MRSVRTRKAPSPLALRAAVCLALTCVSARAGAQGAPPQPGPVTPPTTTPPSAAAHARAAELFKKSVDTYRSGDFKQTIDLLNEAYALEPQPVLLYNLARAHEGIGNNDAAIETYEKFLAQEPNAKDRGAIEQRLATLKRQRDERLALEKKSAAQPAPQPVEPPHERPVHRRSVLPYVVGGVGVAGLAAGAVFGLMAGSKRDDAVAAPGQRDSLDLEDQAKSRATLANVSFVVGGVLLAAGVTWWVLDLNASKKSASIPAMRVGLGAGLLQLGGALP
jgi:tetratricopeptide (TPR) repeat protein